MSLYVVQTGGISLRCDMDYSLSKEVVCVVEGVDNTCLAEVVKKLGLGDLIKDKNNHIYISTSIFTIGKTPGEVIREIATLLRFC
ncbi:MAG: hypothetical protein ACK4M3_01705 [Pyrobaculum sp.]